MGSKNEVPFEEGSILSEIFESLYSEKEYFIFHPLKRCKFNIEMEHRC